MARSTSSLRPSAPSEARDLAVGEVRFEAKENGWVRVERTPTGFRVTHAKDAGKDKPLRSVIGRLHSSKITRQLVHMLSELITKASSFEDVETFLRRIGQHDAKLYGVTHKTANGKRLLPFVPKKSFPSSN